MSETFIINAEPRSDTGKGASRRLRRQGWVPGIVYGANLPPQMISVEHNVLVKQLAHEAFYSTLINLLLDGETTQVVLKDLHRHPSKPFILHLDLLRVNQDEALRLTVPIHFLNEETCKGVKLGGQVSHHITELEITCLPRDLPEFIAVDMIDLDMGDSIHLADMTLPAGVELAHALDADTLIVVVHTPHTTGDESGDESSAS
ncbi:50S ribosomal protein L25/general stress protein Ctc [Rhodoferax sp. 4810]|uniref:Large ribosomal subunit protein bL25 n=1 Tax=Thiospirillum jenense TaxID=1653858 RepID=A0A839HEG9_9GAMM|nr:50S ribosomal protein L25/general stress protein Ctc [Thiospirillum jenense]MBB1075485.1 50S ribosomal protein L25/general stress protein Ctc [Rhodoferax jenense]MBB1126864.1 50S ribosomal protein L25/general stress protein Ctc [Thiospirillum jenense]